MISSITTSLFSQNIAQTYELAKEQFNIENYNLSIQLFQRILCFGDKDQKNACYQDLADCYFQLRDYENAYEYYEIAYFIIPDDSIRNEITFKKTLTLLFDNKYHLALIELLDSKFSNSSYLRQKRKLYLGITYFFLNDFEKSEASFQEFLDEVCPENKDFLEGIFVNNKKIDRISVKTAKRMSMIVPGLGQLYVGDVKNAINSAVLNFTLLILTIYVGINYGIPNAAVSILPWMFRYYSGGINKVEEIARQKILIKRKKIYSDLLQLLNRCQAID